MPAPLRTLETESDGPPRVLLLALGPRVSDRAAEYAAQLASDDVEVLLLVVDEQRRSDHDLDGRVRIHQVTDAEEKLPLRALQDLLVHRIPERLLSSTRRVGARIGLGRPLAVLARGHRTLARPLDRIFMVGYGQLRPWLLARRAVRTVRWDEIGRIDAIVAGDIDSVTLGCMLARRHPHAIATAALRRELSTSRTSG